MPAWNGNRRGAALEVSAEWSGGSVVLDLEGRLTADSDTEGLRQAMRWLEGRGPMRVVLNLERVERLDCSGIGMLVRLRNGLGRQGGTVALAGLGRWQKRMLQLAGLLEVFPAYDSRQDAVDACTWTRRPEAGTAVAGRFPPERPWREVYEHAHR